MPCFRICQFNHTKQPNCHPEKDYNSMASQRKWWDVWDLRILILYILIAQLYLLFFGRLRRRYKSPWMMIVNVWLLYLFSDLFSTIALGKLSKLKIGKDDGKDALRVMWAPLILFYLGGPDTITILRVEENQLWVRHLTGLFTLGLRALYALIVTWNHDDLVLSLLTVLLFITGIIKYGERVWVVWSRSMNEGFIQLDSPTIDKICAMRPKAKLRLLAYSWLQTLRPHRKDYSCDSSEVRNLVTNFHKLVSTSTADAFELIEIELGLTYDMLFSKVGMIFTLLGCILRFLSFSLIVSALVIYVACNMHHGHSEGDHVVTISMLAGAIFLEITGIIVQLRSDWAMVWACKNRSEWATLVLIVHEFLISKCPSQRWTGVMGQFSLPEFYKNSKPTVCNKTWEFLFGREKILKRFSLRESLALQESLGLQKSPVTPVQPVEDLIMDHLRKKFVQTSTTVADVADQEIANANNLQTSTTVADVDTSETSTQKIAEADSLRTSTQKIADQEIANANNLQTSTTVADVDTSETSTQKIADQEITNANNLQTSTQKIAKADSLRTSTQKIADREIADANNLQTSTHKTADVDTSQTTQEIKDDNLQEFEWDIDQEFGQTIVIWHIATAVCYKQHTLKAGKDMVKSKAVKILSDYMMHLLVACPSRFPFCKRYEKIVQIYRKIVQDYTNKKELSVGGKSKEVENEGNTIVITLVNTLVNKMERNEKRWDLMGSVWVEMLCCAARKCPVENHIQELRHGGEFLTHVWLLLMHFGILKSPERRNTSLKDELDSGVKYIGSTIADRFSR
ncbi:hypothetical protein Vadar_028730 [Vaccinium darrowii]|uniref:Uncharacterized protein n=1 Tax=Vaccinium darrowii TaxID=229202 RepID=A0ACB7Y2F6_9ERIC|nr:hypothetical protein Vadar_028730 [Vaccinium darrowii]